MRDLQKEPDRRNIALDEVGISGVLCPVNVMDRTKGLQATVARVKMAVNLPHRYRGTHMSRFMEILSRFREDIRLESLEAMLDAMKEHSKPVKPVRLGVIGKQHLKNKCEQAGCAMKTFTYRKILGESEGVPWVIETAFATHKDEEFFSATQVTGVNWSPGIVNPFRELGHLGYGLERVLTRQRVDRQDPVIYVAHMACPRVEYTDRGKSAVVMNSASSTDHSEDDEDETEE